MHVAAPPSGEVSLGDLEEVILQQAIHCGRPAASTAFRELARVLTERGRDGETVPPPARSGAAWRSLNHTVRSARPGARARAWPVDSWFGGTLGSANPRSRSRPHE